MMQGGMMHKSQGGNKMKSDMSMEERMNMMQEHMHMMQMMMGQMMGHHGQEEQGDGH